MPSPFMFELHRKRLIELLARYTAPPNEGGCCYWTGPVDKDGYGCIGIGRYKYRISHVVWQLANGPVPAGLFMLHKCDAPPCITLEHLFPGTPADNSKDMVLKGRSARGEKQHKAKLTAEDVLAIRAGEKGPWPISAQHKSRVKHGHSWKHIKDKA